MTSKDLGLLVGLASIIIFLPAFALNIYFSIVMVRNREPDVPRLPGDGPLNFVFRPGQLTEKGLKARKLCIICLIVMLAALATNFVLPLLI
jgi:hypothetical protein